MDNKFEITRRYASTLLTGQWLEDAVEKMRSFCEPVSYINTSYDLVRGDKIRVKDLQEWVTHVKEKWPEISNSSVSLSGDSRRLYFYCNHKSGTFELGIEGNSMDEVERIFGQMETGLHLGVPAENMENAVAQRVRFLATAAFSLERFDKTINYLTSLVTDTEHFNGSYVLGSYFYGQANSIKNRDEWASSIKKNWAEVTESAFAFYPRLQIRYDHRRSILDLEVSTSSFESGKKMIAGIEKELSLTRIDEDPYRYRKSAASYKIGDWNRKRFASSTRLFFQERFGDLEPAVSEAYVIKTIDNKIERLESFYKVSTFLAFIEDAEESTIERAFLGVEGNGLLIGIDLNIKDKKLQFKSNIEPSDVEGEIVKYYKTPLQLSPTKGGSTGSAISSTGDANPEKWWVKYLAPILAVVVTAITVLIALARSYFTDYDLKVTSPVQSPVAVNAPRLLLIWHLYPRDVFLKDADYHPSTTILVTHNGDSVQEFSKIFPPFTVPLKKGEGDYLIQVRSEKKSQPVTLVVNYKQRPDSLTTSR